MKDSDLSKKTLSLYDNPDYAQKYADSIDGLLDSVPINELASRLKQGARVLDVASCGGRDSNYLKSKGFKVTGIDLSGSLINIARHKYPNIDFIQGNFLEMPFVDASFDGIWCKAALVHLPSQKDVAEALREFNRVLKSGGNIGIITKARLTGEPATAHKIDKLSSKERYFRYQEKAEFTKLCEDNGLKVLKTELFNELERGAKYAGRDEKWLIVFAQKP